MKALAEELTVSHTGSLNEKFPSRMFFRTAFKSPPSQPPNGVFPESSAKANTSTLHTAIASFRVASTNHLRSNGIWCSDDVAVKLARCKVASDTKVNHLEYTRRGKQKVLQLNVAVKNVVSVQVLDSRQELLDEAAGFVFREMTILM
jgi:hypothetical protein